MATYITDITDAEPAKKP